MTGCGQRNTELSFIAIDEITDTIRPTPAPAPVPLYNVLITVAIYDVESLSHWPPICGSLVPGRNLGVTLGQRRAGGW